MANTATDLTEEDAADLQFPKEWTENTERKPKLESNFDHGLHTIDHSLDENSTVQTCEVCFNVNQHCSCFKCINCGCSLIVPFIECCECKDVHICCQCFSKGSEKDTHKSDHRYRIMKHDIILFENSNWTAEEEITILDVLFTYGYGNWEMIAKKLQNRTQEEIKNHYDTFFLDKPASNLLPKVPETKQSFFPKPIIPYRYKLFNVEEPPRYSTNTIGYQSVAGYNAARSDFELEYDTNSEAILANITEHELDENHSSYKRMVDLQLGLVISYNHRLRERARRKRVIRSHGLILIRKTMSWLHRYEKTITRPVAERMLIFMQYMRGMEFDFLMEGLHRSVELMQQIAKLSEYRKKGITSLLGAEMYDSLRLERDEATKDLQSFKSNPQFNWKNLENFALQKPVHSIPNKRGQFRPLDIIGLPGFEKLLPKEQELCSKVRLVPQSYLELRDLLVTECKKTGTIRLQVARKMLKIDVNKTRKLFDFLVEEGYITKPSN